MKRKFLLGLTVLAFAVSAVPNAAFAAPDDKVTVCVVSNGNGTPAHTVTIPGHAADNAPFENCLEVDSELLGEIDLLFLFREFDFGGFRLRSSSLDGRVSAADVADALARTA